MLVDHPQLFKKKLKKILSIVEQAQSDAKLESNLLDYIKLTYSEAEQNYITAYSDKFSLGLTSEKLKAHQVDPKKPRGLFFKQMKTLMDAPAPENSKSSQREEKVQKENPYLQEVRKKINDLIRKPLSPPRPKPQSKNLTQTKTRHASPYRLSPLRPEIKKHRHSQSVVRKQKSTDSPVPRRYDDEVLFIYKVGKDQDEAYHDKVYSIHGSIGKVSKSEGSEKLHRIKEYNNRVKSYFKPSLDPSKSLLLKMQDTSGAKFSSIRDIPRVKFL